MVLGNCQACTDYWLRNGRHMDGYKYLSRDLHIPRAHLAPMAGRTFHKSTPQCAPLRRPCSIDYGGKKWAGLMGGGKKGGRPMANDSEDEDFDDEFDDDSEDEGFDDDRKEEEKEEGRTDGKGKENVEMDTRWHILLYKAAMHGDWETGKEILNLHGIKALRATITDYSETALHIAVSSGRGRQSFVQELLKLVSEENLEVKTSHGCTPLAIAAKVGNVEVANY